MFASAVADEIVACLSEAISERGTASLVLAGGSTPSSIYRMLGIPPRVGEVEWDKVHLFWGDERWVAQEDNQSNYRMVKETLLHNILNNAPMVHPVDIAASSPETAATKYETEIRSALGTPEGEQPVFDIVLLGIGEDGHTASIFPQSPVMGTDQVCAAVKNPSGSTRVTLTPATLLKARKILFIVKGDNKASVVREVLEGGDVVENLPAKLFHQAGDRVTWFLDSSAAKKLNSERLSA